MRSLQGGWPACAPQALGQEGVSAHLALSSRFCTAKHSCSCSLLRDLLPATRCPRKHTSLGGFLAAPRALPLGAGGVRLSAIRDWRSPERPPVQQKSKVRL